MGTDNAPYDPKVQDDRDPHWMLGEPDRRLRGARRSVAEAGSVTFSVRVVIWIAIGILVLAAWALLPGCAAPIVAVAAPKSALDVGSSADLTTSASEARTEWNRG